MEMFVMSVKDLKKGLKKAKVPENEIDIVVHNFEEITKSTKLDKNKIKIVVHNLINIPDYRKKFMSNPKGAIDEANPQPSP